MGQRIRFLYIGPAPGVHAWGLPHGPDPRTVDILRYQELVLRAVHELLQPLGVSERILKDWLLSKAGYIDPPGQLHSTESIKLELPLFDNLEYLRLDTF